MIKHVTIILLLTYSFSVMYFYAWTQHTKPIYWAQWMHGIWVCFACWALGLIAGSCAVTYSIMQWGFINGFAVFAGLTLLMIGTIRSLAFIFPLQVMFAIICGIIGTFILIT